MKRVQSKTAQEKIRNENFTPVILVKESFFQTRNKLESKAKQSEARRKKVLFEQQRSANHDLFSSDYSDSTFIHVCEHNDR